jgi:hypothetical protein
LESCGICFALNPYAYSGVDTGEIVTSSKGNSLAVDHGQGVIATKDNNETANYMLIGAENFTQAGKTVFRGSVVYSTNSTGNLSFLNNMIGIFKGDGDITTGNFVSTEWEWK